MLDRLSREFYAFVCGEENLFMKWITVGKASYQNREDTYDSNKRVRTTSIR
jgi:hypothetical protein